MERSSVEPMATFLWRQTAPRACHQRRPEPAGTWQPAAAGRPDDPQHRDGERPHLAPAGLTGSGHAKARCPTHQQLKHLAGKLHSALTWELAKQLKQRPTNAGGTGLAGLGGERRRHRWRLCTWKKPSVFGSSRVRAGCAVGVSRRWREATAVAGSSWGCERRAAAMKSPCPRWGRRRRRARRRCPHGPATALPLPDGDGEGGSESE